MLTPPPRRQPATSNRAQVNRPSGQAPAQRRPASSRVAVARQSQPAPRPVSQRPRAVAAPTPGQRVLRAGILAAKTYGEYNQGVVEGLLGSVKSTWGFVTKDAWEVKTWTEMGTTVVAVTLMSPQHMGTAQWLDGKLGTQFGPRQMQIVMALDQTFKEMPHWQARQWGQLVGRVAGDVLTTKGAGAGVKVAGRVAGTAGRVAKTNVASWGLSGMGTRQAATTVAQRLPTILTDAEGYLIGPIRLTTPFSLRVQRFGLMSVNKPDYWGPATFGTSRHAARAFNAILPNWNDLTLYTRGTIPKGANLKIGITGAQGWRYPGGLYQVQTNSRNVVQQSSKLLPKGK